MKDMLRWAGPKENIDLLQAELVAEGHQSRARQRPGRGGAPAARRGAAIPDRQGDRTLARKGAAEAVVPRRPETAKPTEANQSGKAVSSTMPVARDKRLDFLEGLSGSSSSSDSGSVASEAEGDGKLPDKDLPSSGVHFSAASSGPQVRIVHDLRA